MWWRIIGRPKVVEEVIISDEIRPRRIHLGYLMSDPPDLPIQSGIVIEGGFPFFEIESRQANKKDPVEPTDSTEPPED
jgi:hypothetical protein